MRRITDRSDVVNPSFGAMLIFLVMCFVFPAFILGTSSPTTSSDNESASGFTIESYDVILDVGKDNKVKVTESITVNWYEDNHHGIYRFIPTWLEYTGKDNKVIKRKANVYDLKSTSDEYSTSTINKKERIRLGDPYAYVLQGIHTYTIEYMYDMGADPYKGFDEFIFHAFGDYWSTRIKNASLRIIMPTEVYKGDVSFYADKHRKENITRLVDYEVIGNTIFASVSDDYTLLRSLTVDIALEDGYFENCNNTYGYKSLIVCISIIIITIIIFILWFLFGKDYENEPQTVEFYPPENLDPSEIGYIYGKQTSKRLTVSLIVSLAAKGYVKINDNNNQIEIVQNNPTKVLESMPEVRTVVVKKGKEPDSSLNDVETLWMNHLFNKSDEKELVSGFDEFYNKCNTLIEKGYVIVKQDTTSKPDMSESLPKKDLPELTETEQIVFDSLFSVSNPMILNTDPLFYKTFEKVSNALVKKYRSKIEETRANTLKVSSFITTFFLFVTWMVAYTNFEDLNPLYSWLYYVAFACIPICGVLSIIMDRKTKYGEQMEARILGFKNYIETAEKYEIEQRVEQDPEYFYKILPYAYVLNVSKKWIEKFENIKMPEVDIGTFNYYNDNSFDTLGTSIHYPVSSGSSSCGGGCSSCGGGCSSCGGGGSW